MAILEMDERESSVAGSRHEPAKPSILNNRLRIGCALLPKKVSRYLTPSMKAIAAEAGIELCLIDYTKPLKEQGPFNAIIHKLRPSKEWETMLQDYAKANPHVRVIDRVDGIRTLRNRATMLSALHGDGIVLQSPFEDISPVRVQAPVQVEIPEDMTLDEAELLMEEAAMTPPLLVKPLWTDGREGSHGLAVVHDIALLGKLLAGAVSPSFRPPVVIQQFVEHGGVLHKVYVLGDTTVVCKRPSLGDNYMTASGQKGVLQVLPRISCKSVTFDCSRPSPDAECSSPGPSNSSPSPEMALADSESDLFTPGSRPSSPDESRPPEWVTHDLASELRQRLGMDLFNFDLICPEDQSVSGEDLYYVIDINYFPGVDKIPRFEEVFVQFLRDICQDSALQ